ncbi:MAG: undecaprenyl/decaprenyl-phosphate alpha-N-acetylglucosaminyl 1-phosphate transferase [Magnetococcales bacterium]|nr:undecaprenyl/decaprenyl-phosphate alpha-N-acetylglucosaminyl 1-phosphate transferase [Magnetococcales bacterium]
MTYISDISILNIPFFYLVIIICSTVTCIYIGVFLAPIIGLVEKPSNCKKHESIIPLVGGIALFFGLLPTLFLLENSIPHQERFWLASLFILFIGVWDDRVGLSIRKRFVIEILIAFMITADGGLTVMSLGNIFGFGEIELGLFAVPFTIICIVGVINALNMVDGIDGLTAGLSLVSMFAMLYLAIKVGRNAEAQMILMIISALIPIFIYNSRIFGQKSARFFMGDGGSMLLGLFLAWFTISLSQTFTPNNEEQVFVAFPAVIALWLLSIPLIELFSSILRRLISGKNPFKSDVKHIHHLLISAGFNANITLIIIMGVATVMVAFTIIAFEAAIGDEILFISILFVFAAFSIFSNVYWKKLDSQDKTKNIFQ